MERATRFMLLVITDVGLAIVYGRQRLEEGHRGAEEIGERGGARMDDGE